MVSIQITMYNYWALIDKIMQVSGHGEKKTLKSHVFGLMHGIHQIYMIKR